MKFWKIGVFAIILALIMGVMVGCQGGEAEEESTPDLTDQVADTTKETVEVSTDPFYVLLMGLDSRDGTVEDGPSDSRSDVMMLVRVDPKTYQIGLLSVPRDTYAWINDTDNKINEAHYLFGPEAAVDEVEKLTGVRADYYMETKFTGFEALIDAVGGVDAYVPIDFSLKDIVKGGKVHMTAGEQHLDGSQALVLARERHAYDYEGEACRQTNNRAMVENLIKQAAASGDIAKYADAVYDNCDTNMDREVYEQYLSMFCGNADAISFVDGTTPFETGMDENIGLVVAWRDEDTSHQVADAVAKHEDPKQIVMPPQFQ